jgi:hypothetical protein
MVEIAVDTTDFRKYLLSSKEALQEQTIYCLNNSPVTVNTHLVLGNEAADLDSIVSAVAYAFLCQKKSKK